MIVPYYDKDGITIYCGDCRAILPYLTEVRSIITDPPYGIQLQANYLKTRKASQKKDTRRKAWLSKAHNDIIGDREPFDPLHLFETRAKAFALWGANAYSDKLFPSYSWLVWDKKDGRGASNSFSDCELCWCYGFDFKSVRIFRHLWCGYQRDSEVGQGSLHPTQKPVALMRWVIETTKAQGLICDPYIGSGTTLVAAQQLGRRAVGIELSEEYCKIAVERLRQSSIFSLPEMQQVESNHKQLEIGLNES